MVTAFLLAGAVKGVIGMGLPTIAIGVLGLAMPPSQAAALIIAPSLVTNLWQAFAGAGLGRLLRRFGLLLAGLATSTPLGVWLFADLPAAAATGSLGTVLAVYGLLGLSRFHPSVGPGGEARWSLPVGIATGILSGATGVFVMPLVPFLNALRLGKDDLIQMLGIAFVVATVAMAVGLALIGRFGVTVAGQSLVAVVPALIGMGCGQWLRSRLSAENFRRGFFIGMLALGSVMGLRALL